MYMKTSPTLTQGSLAASQAGGQPASTHLKLLFGIGKHPKKTSFTIKHTFLSLLHSRTQLLYVVPVVLVW